MGNAHIWRRLLWKEFRESGLVLLVGTALPLLLLLHRNEKEDLWSLPVTALCTILVVMWAVDRVHRQQAITRVKLPITPVMRWVTTYMLPILVPLCVGASVGYITSRDYTNMNMHGFVFVSAFFVLVIFLLCSVLTAVFSAIPAIIVGVLFLLSYDPVTLAGMKLVLVHMLVAGVLASVVWDIAHRKYRLLLGRVAVTILLIGIVFGKSLMKIPEDIAKSRYEGYCASSQLSSPDWSYRVNSSSVSANQTTINYLKYVDYKNTRSSTIESNRYMLPLVFRDRTHPLYAQEGSDKSSFSIREWDIETGNTRELGSIPAGPDGIKRLYSADISPDGQYLVVSVKSRLGVGTDLWIEKLGSRQTGLVMPNVALTPNLYGNDSWRNLMSRTAWSQNQLIVSRNGTYVAIDLQSMKARYLNLPSVKGDVR